MEADNDPTENFFYHLDKTENVELMSLLLQTCNKFLSKGFGISTGFRPLGQILPAATHLSNNFSVLTVQNDKSLKVSNLLKEPKANHYKSVLSSPEPLMSTRKKKYDKRVLRFTMEDGNRSCDPDITERQYRLYNGMWLRAKKTNPEHDWVRKTQRKRRQINTIFTCRFQSQWQGKMVTTYWKRRKVIPGDPYEPYHDFQHRILKGPQALRHY